MTAGSPGKAPFYRRAFLAVALPLLSQHAFSEWQTRLQSALQGQQLGDPFTWVAPPKAHITLRFLGDSNKAQLAALVPHLAPIAQQFSAFSITLDKLGWFSRGRTPQVLWLGIAQGLESLGQLAAQLEQAAQQAGFPAEERPFSPHVTLGRANRRADRAQLAQAGQWLQRVLPAEEPITFQAEEVTLFYSGEESAKQRYTKFASAKLGTVSPR
jgi:2'-5' RNA ligase